MPGNYTLKALIFFLETPFEAYFLALPFLNLKIK